MTGIDTYPFGDEIPSTSNDREKFATYTRDRYTGLDYADQRYFASTYGRFNTPDPYQASGGPKSPASWNRYSYTRGDPVNRIDASGLADCFTDDPTCNPDASDPNLTGPSCLGESFVSVCDMGDSNSAPVGVPSDEGTSETPTCDQVLTSQLSTFLSAQDPKLLAWDPDLAAQFVSIGQKDGVDPRLMASIATLESGHGGTFGGTNNPFGLGPGWNFKTPLAAINSQGITLKHLVGYGDTNVSALYSGLPGIEGPNKSYAQVPAYCQSSVAGCQVRIPTM